MRPCTIRSDSRETPPEANMDIPLGGTSSAIASSLARGLTFDVGTRLPIDPAGLTASLRSPALKCPLTK